MRYLTWVQLGKYPGIRTVGDTWISIYFHRKWRRNDFKGTDGPKQREMDCWMDHGTNSCVYLHWSVCGIKQGITLWGDGTAVCFFIFKTMLFIQFVEKIVDRVSKILIEM